MKSRVTGKRHAIAGARAGAAARARARVGARVSIILLSCWYI